MWKIDTVIDGRAVEAIGLVEVVIFLLGGSPGKVVGDGPVTWPV